MGLLTYAVFCMAVGVQVETRDNTVTTVVKLLQGMMDKSKSDGDADRDAYAKFKCYCDSNTEATQGTIDQANSDIDSESTFLADRRAANEKLSQEVAHLKASMDENEEARSEASTIRNEENLDFVQEESDLVTALAQMERAIDLLSAVGADQTANTGADHTRFMAAGSVAAAGGLLEKRASLKELGTDMKAVVRAASVFLSNAQRKALTSFIQAPFTGQYTSQSTEIVGILKNMNDTFDSNLAAARTKETKAASDHAEYIRLATKEFRVMNRDWNTKKTEVGTNARDIATSTTELSSAESTLKDSQNFMSDLTNRCSTKAKEFEQRKMLRANEEAAIAQAIAILNSDSAFDTFGDAAATSTGGTSFVELSARDAEHAARHAAAASLIRQARALKSLNLARVASSLTAENPFVEVLTMINETIGTIALEGADDLKKKNWCASEQSTGNTNKGNKDTEIGGYTTNIGNLDISRTNTLGQIQTTEDDLVQYHASQDAETETRRATNGQFKGELSNLQEAEKILTKATQVLEKYYQWLHLHNGEHTYQEYPGEDSGGAQLERFAGKTPDELKELCSERPDCAGFNTNGWLKSEIATSKEFYDADGTLYVKKFTQTMSEAASSLLQQQPAAGENDGSSAIDGEESTWGSEMGGQRGQGNEVITMLKFITSETVKERNNAIATEQSAQNSFETLMNQLAANIKTANTNLGTYQSNLAQTESDLETAHENKAAAEAERTAIVKYLADIQPGCTFIQSNFQTREANREAETTALQGAIETLRGTPAFQAAAAEEEREKLGKCRGVCVQKGNAHAECQACLEGVTVYGYCVQNSGAEGCDSAIPTGSAASIA